MDRGIESFPMDNLHHETVPDIVTREVIHVSRFGVSNEIHSDQGGQFDGIVFKVLCDLLHIKNTSTNLCHLQSDGMVERLNRMLMTMLGAYVNTHHTNWDDHIPFVMMSYRSSMHGAI